MVANKFLYLITLGVALGLGPRVTAQVQTDVPAAVPGAKPVSFERIKIHGKALEGNLEGDDVDRDVFVFLPPSYSKEKSRRYPVVYALHGYSIGLWGAMPSIVRTPYFGFAQLFQAEDSVSSNYHSLQAKLNKRFSNGLSFLASYTWSHSVDGASVFFGSGANATTIFPQDNYNLAAERGNSDFDIRQRLSWSFTYEVPALRRLPKLLGEGWQVGGTLTLQTGQPFSVLTGNGLSGTGLGNDLPDLVGDPNAGPHTVQKWFNTAAFVDNQPLTFGDAGRNIVTGPGYRDFDFSVLKNVKIGEKANAQFRAEFFNITNHPSFALPADISAAPNFGALFTTPDAAQNNVGLGSGGPRLIQLALKRSF